MNKSVVAMRYVLILLLVAGWPNAARSEQRAIDVERSVMKVYAFKSGLFSVFAHNHEILAPIASGWVEESENPLVELRVETAAMEVLDPKVSDKDRASIQTTMMGPEMLEAAAYPQIRFVSTTVERQGEDRWTVLGDLELHGQSRPVAFDVSLQEGIYRGSAKLKQSEFGIQPISLFGGSVKVKDEVRVDFEVVLEP